MDVLFFLALAIGICIAFFYASRWAFSQRTASLRGDRRSIKKLLDELEEWRKQENQK